jgi:hypothetical protein
MDFTCKAQHTGIGQFVRCLEHQASGCPFAVPLGGTFFCKSPQWAHFYKKQNIKNQKNLTIQEKEDETRMIS